MKPINLLAITALCLLAAGTLQAYHGTTYLYDVRGYVLDADEQPITGTRVSVRAGTVGGSATTNARGYYSVLLQLHLEDWGQSLRVRTDHGEAESVVRFQTDDSNRTHVHHVNLIGGELNETQLVDRDLIGWLYIVGAILLAIIVVIIAWRLLRRLRPRRARSAPTEPAVKTRTGSKKKRRKRI